MNDFKPKIQLSQRNLKDKIEKVKLHLNTGKTNSETKEGKNRINDNYSIYTYISPVLCSEKILNIK